MPEVGTPYVELIAVMAKYSPFAEKAGMLKVAEQQSNENISKVSKVLLELGSDLQLLDSERYVTGRLESLNPEQMCKLKETFLRNPHPRFKREFTVSRHQPYGKTTDYQIAIQKADPTKLTKLIKLVGMLMQTKVYLFWSSNASDQKIES